MSREQCLERRCWLENYYIVCDQSSNMNFYFEGNYVISRDRKKSKFGIVFYQEATSAAFDRAKWYKVQDVRERQKCSNEKECQKLIKTLRDKGIETSACAVIAPKRISISSYRSKLGTLQQKISSAAVHYGCSDLGWST